MIAKYWEIKDKVDDWRLDFKAKYGNARTRLFCYIVLNFKEHIAKGFFKRAILWDTGKVDIECWKEGRLHIKH